jgi:adenylosuccinate lyase
MMALAEKGMPRLEALRLLQQLIFESQNGKKSLRAELGSNSTVRKYLSDAEIDAALDPKLYLGMSHQLIDDAMGKTLAERRARGIEA